MKFLCPEQKIAVSNRSDIFSVEKIGKPKKKLYEVLLNKFRIELKFNKK